MRLCAPNSLIKTVAATGTPERLSSTHREFYRATFIGIKAARTANATTAYVGPGATNDTQIFEILPGTQYTVDAGDGNKLDLYDFYVDVTTNGDGIGVIFW